MPVFAVTALFIKLTDGGPVFVIQQRVGKDGRLFDFYKFRSMIVGAERLLESLLLKNDYGPSMRKTFKMRRDPRVTWVGRIIRKTSIDELPQLLNVLKGDMSIVGPRPALPEEVAHYSENERGRLAILPGLTCYWQVKGRALLSFDQQVKLDLEYMQRQSLLTDIVIILRTVPAVLSGHGAY